LPSCRAYSTIALRLGLHGAPMSSDHTGSFFVLAGCSVEKIHTQWLPEHSHAPHDGTILKIAIWYAWFDKDGRRFPSM
jgi:hypothetical protein